MLAAACGSTTIDSHSPLMGVSAQGGPYPTSIVNTRANVTQSENGWISDMGPLNPAFGGIACDNKAGAEGDWQRYRRGDALLWFIAPSDTMQEFGLKLCGPNKHGHEPTCEENYQLCGRKIRVRCSPGSPWCARAGEETLLSQISRGEVPVNNDAPDYYVNETRRAVGEGAKVPTSIVLVINDFCPKGHTVNIRNGACQVPQLDISTSTYLMLGVENAQGYTHTDLGLNAELLAPDDQSSLGPEYPDGARTCSPAAKDPDGDGWGWENNKSCRMPAVSTPVVTQPSNGATPPTCSPAAKDPDGDGWGWENNKSCRMPAVTQPSHGATPASCSPAAKDPDGDGWGWEHGKSCRMPLPSTPVTIPAPAALTLPSPETLRRCPLFTPDPDGDGIGMVNGQYCRIWSIFG